MNSWPRRLLLLGSGIAMGFGLVAILNRFNPRLNPTPVPSHTLPANWPDCSRISLTQTELNRRDSAVFWLVAAERLVAEQVLVLTPADSADRALAEYHPIVPLVSVKDSFRVVVPFPDSALVRTWRFRLYSDSCQGVAQVAETLAPTDAPNK